MRGLVIVALAAGALVVAVPAGACTQSVTSLRITYWEDVANADAKTTWTLGCNPPRGSLSSPVVACRRLAAGGPKLFARLPKDIACTQIYGGPQRARIVGTVSGRMIWATFTRHDGCQITRWNRLVPWLLPPGGMT